jgi:hypothetical protein
MNQTSHSSRSPTSFDANGTKIVTSAAFSRHIVAPCEYPNWSRVVSLRLNELVRLPEGWDGYRARPVDFEIAFFTYQMLQNVCGADTPAPRIVPGSSGDLQCEWHTRNGDLELDVRAPNRVHAWRSTRQTGPDGEERELTVDFTVVARWISEIVETDDRDAASAA